MVLSKVDKNEYGVSAYLLKFVLLLVATSQWNNFMYVELTCCITTAETYKVTCLAQILKL